MTASRRAYARTSVRRPHFGEATALRSGGQPGQVGARARMVLVSGPQIGWDGARPLLTIFGDVIPRCLLQETYTLR